MAVRIILADGHGVVREGIRILLEEKPGFQVVGEAQDGQEMVRLASQLGPDLIITEACLAEINGIDAARRIVSQDGAVKVIVLSARGEPHMVAAALLAGVKGYVLKVYPVDELIRAIQVVTGDQVYLCPKVLSVVVDDYLRSLRPEQHAGIMGLSGRQRLILQRIAEGRNTKQIALEFDLSPKAVEAARRRIMKTIGVANVVSLVKFALANGLTPL